MKFPCVTAVFNAIETGHRNHLIRSVKSVAELKTEHEHLFYDGASAGLYEQLCNQDPSNQSET